MKPVVFVILQAYPSLSVPSLFPILPGATPCGLGVTGATWSW